MSLLYIQYTMYADGEPVHIAQCRGLLINGSNHWIPTILELVRHCLESATLAQLSLRPNFYTQCNLILGGVKPLQCDKL